MVAANAGRKPKPFSERVYAIKSSINTRLSIKAAAIGTMVATTVIACTDFSFEVENNMGGTFQFANMFAGHEREIGWRE
jgi:hypothetical protein